MTVRAWQPTGPADDPPAPPARSASCLHIGPCTRTCSCACARVRAGVCARMCACARACVRVRLCVHASCDDGTNSGAVFDGGHDAVWLQSILKHATPAHFIHTCMHICTHPCNHTPTHPRPLARMLAPSLAHMHTSTDSCTHTRAARDMCCGRLDTCLANLGLMWADLTRQCLANLGLMWAGLTRQCPVF